MSWPFVIALLKLESYSAPETCIVLLGMCNECQQAGKYLLGLFWLSSYCGASENKGSWHNTHIASHSLLCFITSYIRQNRQTKINQHLPNIHWEPWDTVYFQFNSWSVSISQLSQGDEFGFLLPEHLPTLHEPGPNQPITERVLMMRPWSSPSQKARLLGNFLRRVLKGQWRNEQICWDLWALSPLSCRPAHLWQEYPGLLVHSCWNSTGSTPLSCLGLWIWNNTRGAHSDCGLVIRISS